MDQDNQNIYLVTISFHPRYSGNVACIEPHAFKYFFVGEDEESTKKDVVKYLRIIRESRKVKSLELMKVEPPEGMSASTLNSILDHVFAQIGHFTS